MLLTIELSQGVRRATRTRSTGTYGPEVVLRCNCYTVESAIVDLRIRDLTPTDTIPMIGEREKAFFAAQAVVSDCPDIIGGASRHSVQLIIACSWNRDNAPAFPIPVLRECLTSSRYSYRPDILLADSGHSIELTSIIWAVDETPLFPIPVLDQRQAGLSHGRISCRPNILRGDGRHRCERGACTT